MAFPPALAVPSSSPSAVIDRSLAFTVGVNTQLHGISGEGWFGYTQFRYRIVGAGTWTYFPSSTTWQDLAEVNSPYSIYNSATYTFAGNFFAAGDYEMQAQVLWNYNNIDQVSNFGDSKFFSMGTPPAGPAITTPTAGATITQQTQSIAYTYASGQIAAQMQVLNGTTVEWDSGEYTVTGTGESRNATFPTNTGTRTFQVRTKSSGGLWSAWTTRSYTITYAAPTNSTVTATAADPGSVGFTTAFNIDINNPFSGGTFVSSFDVWARPLGSSDPVGIYLGNVVRVSTDTNVIWSGPGAGQWQLRIRTYGTNTTYIDSAWTTLSPTITINGVVLHNPGVPASSICLRLNADGVEEDRAIESATVAVAGREFPIVEFGSMGSREYKVPLVYSEGTTGTTDASKLRALLENRAVVGYRDKRGRAIYGMLTVDTIKDRPYGNTSGLAVEQTYATSTPPKDLA